MKLKLDLELDHFRLLEIPYGLTHDELTLEPDLDLTLSDCLKKLSSTEYTPQEVRRILRGAVILSNKLGDGVFFARCLQTAMIWERG